MKKLLFLTILLISFTSNLFAAEVTLQWDKIDDPNLKGYKLYMGRTVSGSYSFSHPVILASNLADPDNPEYTVTMLSETLTYYFMMRGVNTIDIESEDSNEVVWRYSIPATDPVNNLRIKP